MLLTSKHFTRFYFIVILMIPAFWMIFSEDGQRFVDTALLEFKGGDAMDIHLNALHSSLTEDDIKQQLPDVNFNCGQQQTTFGNRICQAQLASFNNIPSRYGIYYFADGTMTAFKVGYQRSYHRQLLNYIRSQLGTSNENMDNTVPTNVGLYQWSVGNGQLVALKENAIEGQEPALIWTVIR